jgi:7,8-dihydropterin-6-yl-methyl-4-(beta-D-ribofuranosyl)aminobenzene 5'-phosphate synthase
MLRSHVVAEIERRVTAGARYRDGHSFTGAHEGIYRVEHTSVFKTGGARAGLSQRMRASQRLDYIEVKGDDGDFHILRGVNDADAWEIVDFSPERHMTGLAIAMACVLTMPPLQAEAQQPARVTILYDAFGPASALQKDWGFAALIEYGGRRILFDTGNDAGIFARNVKQLGVDLTRLDAVVISHRHGDHTTGLEVLIAANPTVPIYAPQEGAFFRGGVPNEFLTRDASVPANMRYFDGKDPNPLRSGTPWPRGNFQIVTRTTEILPAFFVLTTRSDKPGTRDMNELSLAVRTPKGLAVVVGCSHPGIEKILDAAAQIDKKLYTSIGGFHLVQTPREEIERVAGMLHDTLKLERVAPGHCTSEPGFAAFMRKFGDRFDQAGIGATLQLPR